MACRPHDVTAGLPEAAARLRANRERASPASRCRTTIRIAPGFDERYDENALRAVPARLRPPHRAARQGARDRRGHFVVSYGEWLVPIYRRRRVPMADFMAMLGGLRDACGRAC